MRSKAVGALFVLLLLVGISSSSFAQAPPEFDAVFQIMTQDAGPDSSGCRGCHIGPNPALGPWWGDTAEDVFGSLDVSGLFVGGRMSYLAFRLEQAEMPLFGRPWTPDELNVLYSWLMLYDP